MESGLWIFVTLSYYHCRLKDQKVKDSKIFEIFSEVHLRSQCVQGHKRSASFTKIYRETRWCERVGWKFIEESFLLYIAWAPMKKVITLMQLWNCFHNYFLLTLSNFEPKGENKCKLIVKPDNILVICLPLIWVSFFSVLLKVRIKNKASKEQALFNILYFCCQLYYAERFLNTIFNPIQDEGKKPY